MTRLRMPRILNRRRAAPAVQAPPAGVLPLDVPVPDLSGVAAASDRAGRGAFRLDGVAALAFAGQVDAAVSALRSALGDYDGELPPHDVRDSARRALNLAVTASVLGDRLPATLRDATANAVAHHLAKVEGALPWDDAPALADALTSWTAAALWWPSLPASRHVWSHGLTALAEHGAERVHADGSPRDADPQEALAWVEAALLAARAAKLEGVTLPDALCGAAGAAAWHLYVRGTPDGALRGGEVAPVTSAPGALIHAARDATLAHGWSSGPVAAEASGDALLGLFGADVPAERGPLTTSADWVMYAFRDGPTLVMHGTPRTLRSRGVIDGSPGLLPSPRVVVEGVVATEADASTLECDGMGAENTLDRARIDPRQARGVYLMGTAKRDITFKQGRALVLDTPAGAGTVRATWAAAAGWTAKLEDGKLVATHPSAKKTLRISLDARLEWSLSGRRAEGHGHWDGDIYEPLRTSIEWT